MKGRDTSRSGADAVRADYRIIARMIEPGARVLDLGCGGGDLLDLLAREKSVSGQGVEIDPDNIGRCVSRGVSAIQADVDEGLMDYPDLSFDHAVLVNTLQVVKSPPAVLSEMVRVAKSGVVAFPNFGHWLVRAKLLFGGRMPKTRALPHEWHATPNIHVFTAKDFERLCAELGIAIKERVFLAGGREIGPAMHNLLASEAVYMVRAKEGTKR